MTAVVDEHDGLTVVSDPDDLDRPDVVQGITGPARMLAGLLVPRKVATALDLGTGSGLLALKLARQAGRVVATDVNPRAVAFTRRSAELNGMRNVEVRQGDWYESVRGERFDLIACNPPYVVSPDTRLVFRDGSQATEGVVRGAGAHLTTGGLAHLLVNWVHPPGDWAGPLRGWLPAGCDALAVHHASLLPEQYAATWADTDEERARWLAWYRAEGIAAIGAAFLLLRRRADDGPPRLQALEAARAPTPRAGLHVERILAGTDLAAEPDEVLARRRLRLAKGVRVEDTGVVRCVPTVGVQLALDEDEAARARALDGTAPPADLGLARRLLELGLAEPAA
jgi:methylase of polypeptide subunit release factors